MREQSENGRAYLRELVFGDPDEPYRRAGLALAARLEDGITRLLSRDGYADAADAATLARVITAIIHISTTASSMFSASTRAATARSAGIRKQTILRPTSPPDGQTREDHVRPAPLLTAPASWTFPARIRHGGPGLG